MIEKCIVCISYIPRTVKVYTVVTQVLSLRCHRFLPFHFSFSFTNLLATSASFPSSIACPSLLFICLISLPCLSHSFYTCLHPLHISPFAAPFPTAVSFHISPTLVSFPSFASSYSDTPIVSSVLHHFSLYSIFLHRSLL